MRNDLPNNVSHECYVVEIDGIKQSEHRIFVEALKCGFQLKRQYPHAQSNCAMPKTSHDPMVPCRIESAEVGL